MKRAILFLLFIVFTVTAYSQEKGESIDYKYIRTENDYHSYDIILNKDRSIDLIISSTYQIKNLQKIYVKIGENEIKIPYSIISLPVENDNESVSNLAIRLNIDKLWKNYTAGCDATILFNLQKKQSFELPFDVCKIQDLVLTN